MIEVQNDGAVARIALNRPAARNALTIADWTRLADACDAVRRSEARVLLIASAVPGVFSAGADLKELGTLATEPGQRAPFRGAMRRALDALADLAVPTIVVVEGGCFGAGVALAMAADIRIAGPAARFAIPPARLGIVYPAADVHRLTELVGSSQAVLLLASGQQIDAAEALRIGLVDRLEEGPHGAAEQLAREIAGNAPSSVRLLKRMALDFYPFIEAGEDGLTLGDTVFDDAFGGADFAEGMAALNAKRTPEFEG